MSRLLSDLGERGFINELRNRFPLAMAGDDAAVLGSIKTPVVTTDSFFQGTHFHNWWTTPDKLAARLLEATLSDLAAMGAEPVCVFSSIMLPPEMELDWMIGFYSGLTARGDSPVAGGETIRGEKFGITLTAIGDCTKGKPFMRSQAAPGDSLWVTGPLGRTMNSPALLEKSRKSKLTDAEREQVNAFLSPKARFDAVPYLRRSGCRCAIDISDGLFSECGHICMESSVGIEVDLDRVPLVPYCTGRAVEACSAGEDFELLFTLPPEKTSPFTRIGKVVYENGLTVLSEGKVLSVGKRGFDHFS
ncbi:thiamine-phosphate kinase [Candidatus Fermentibacteria bacterium]|nr:MAG: thiamine-phosphate kinase [Candidatus Fermentibacteria bacterium]